MECTGDIPTPRSAQSASIYNDELYIYGGWDGVQSHNDFYVLDLSIISFFFQIYFLITYFDNQELLFGRNWKLVESKCQH